MLQPQAQCSRKQRESLEALKNKDHEATTSPTLKPPPERTIAEKSPRGELKVQRKITVNSREQERNSWNWLFLYSAENQRKDIINGEGPFKL